MKRNSRSRRHAKSTLFFESLEKRLLLHGGDIESTIAYSTIGHSTHDVAIEATHHSHTDTVEGNSTRQPALEISTEIRDTGVVVAFELTHFHLSEASVDGDHVDGQGHLHLYVDGEKISRVYGNTYELTDLSPGLHTISASLNSNDHRAYTVGGEKIEASVDVIVPNTDRLPKTTPKTIRR